MTDNDKRARRNGIAGLIVIALIVILAFAFKSLILPKLRANQVEATSSGANYTSTLNVCGDSFAGYAPLRSAAMQRELSGRGIRLKWVDDAANYSARVQALRKGECDMAVVTVDANLVAGVEMGEFPASMIFVIDESQGADGVVAYKGSVPNVESLNRPGTKIVVTPNSPSETLARQMISGMLPVLTSESWLQEANGSEEVYKALTRGNSSERKAYVLWEPWLSKALEIDGVHMLYDSSAASGTIMDAMSVNRSYLQGQLDTVVFVTESYFRTLWSYSSKPEGLVELVLRDAELNGTKLTPEQAKRTVAGIQWKTTLENYAHMGLIPRYEARGLLSMDEIISNIARFLVRTGKLQKNPVEGREHELYYDAVLRQLQAQKFHPGGDEEIRGATELPALSDSQWNALMLVGNLDAKSITFRRASSDLSVEGNRDVAAIALQLKGWPNYYITIEGHARAQGDAQANLQLASDRAQTVSDALVASGISRNRVRAQAVTPNRESGEAQSVTFVLAQKPF